MIPTAWIVPLCPVGVSDTGTIETPCDSNLNRDRAAFFFQLFGTFIFVFTIMAIKGMHSGQSKDDAINAICVSFALMSQIYVSANQGGACYNPAVALAQLTFGIAQTTGPYHVSQLHYSWIFIGVPFLGGTIAGICQIFHNKTCATMTLE